MLIRSSYLVYCSALAVLKLLINFEQGTLHFYFALGPENYVAGPDDLGSGRSLVWRGRVKRACYLKSGGAMFESQICHLTVQSSLSFLIHKIGIRRDSYSQS